MDDGCPQVVVFCGLFDVGEEDGDVLVRAVCAFGVKRSSSSLLSELRDFGKIW